MHPTILDEIIQAKRTHIASRKREWPLEMLIGDPRYKEPRRGFLNRLRAAPGRVALIAEVKKASPSRGIICHDFDPVAIARQYELGGASCLSVLTDYPYFQGSDKDLMAARAATQLPVLRKDFIIDEYQIYESKYLGADCILLIVSALADTKDLKTLFDTAKSIGLDVLVEVHDEAELEIAAGLKAELIGINNRNLKTFETDLATTERLAPLAPSDSIVVSESAIRTHEDVCRVADAGARAILVGEGLVEQPDIPLAIKRLMCT